MKKRFISFFPTLVFMMSIVSCGLYLKEEIKELDRSYYSLNGSSVQQIIEDLSESNLLQLETAPLGKINPDNLVLWSSSDFNVILNLINTTIWTETEGDWKLHYLSYAWSCQFLAYGPQSASAIYYLINPDSRYSSDIYLHPTQDFFAIVRKIHTPRIGQWEEIDLSKTQIMPEEALKIAEANGGLSFREGIENQCTVNVIHNASYFDGWQILYSPNEGMALVIKINSKTGKIIE